MNEIVNKLKAFMHCTYDDPSEYITEEWLRDKTNLQTVITIISYSIADDLKRLADGIYDEVDAYGIEYNIDFDFELLKQLKALV